jgi:hypothetical protein|tara:strand:+ start:1230 stop:3068 length:1839 start_codon:yes stop_codon:yes gene_type:complete
MRVITLILSFTLLLSHYLDAQNILNKIGAGVTCGESIFDSGGASSNYENNAYSEATFHPSAEDEYVSIEFIHAYIEGCCDIINIYDGENIEAPLIRGGPSKDNELNGQIYSASPSNLSGSITITFSSDQVIEYSGWEVHVQCLKRSEVYGCTNPLSCNFNPLANIDDNSCMNYFGCNNANAINYDANALCDNNTCLILGCTNQVAINYNPNSNLDDGSCIVKGCANVLMFNYNPEVTIGDGFCIPIIYGCMNNYAYNYNTASNIDDNSCVNKRSGCLDVNAINYNPLANVDDYSCEFIPIYGCSNPLYLEYDTKVNLDDGTCNNYIIYGCTNQVSINYNPNSNLDDGSCVNENNYNLVYGCTNKSACNYNPQANSDGGSCEFPDGCTDEKAINYDPEASCDNGTCEFITISTNMIYGCIDESACNYNPQSNSDDGSCEFPDGCTDEKAINYDPEASCDNGTCQSKIHGCIDKKYIEYNPQANIEDESCKTELDIGLKYLGGYIFELNYKNNGEPFGKVVSESDLGTFTWEEARTKAITSNINDFDDWYIPDVADFNSIYRAIEKIEQNNFDKHYWTSKPYKTLSAIVFDMSNNNSCSTSIQYKYKLRVIRAF